MALVFAHRRLIIQATQSGGTKGLIERTNWVMPPEMVADRTLKRARDANPIGHYFPFNVK